MTSVWVLLMECFIVLIHAMSILHAISVLQIKYTIHFKRSFLEIVYSVLTLWGMENALNFNSYIYTASDRQFANACQGGHMERLAEGQLVNQLYVPSSICHTLQ